MGWLPLLRTPISDGDSEKKAVSEPDTRPERIMRNTKINKPITDSIEKPRNNWFATFINRSGKGSKSISSKVLKLIVAAKLIRIYQTQIQSLDF